MAEQRLYVGGIPYSAKSVDLYAYFTQFGQVNSAEVLIDGLTGRTKGIGFVTMLDEEGAFSAISSGNHSNFKRHKITVSKSSPRPRFGESQSSFGSKREIYKRSNQDIPERSQEFRFDESGTSLTDRYNYVDPNNDHKDIVNDLLKSSLRENVIIRPEDLEAQIRINQKFGVEFMSRFREDPNLFHQLSSDDFEEFIAEIFRNSGFNIEVTGKTRDGGKDIIAIQDGIVKVKYYIECKRYAPDNKIDIGIVKKLHSTVVADKVTKGIIVTTSSFTKPSRQFIDENKWQLEGNDKDSIQNWLEVYVKTYKTPQNDK